MFSRSQVTALTAQAALAATYNAYDDAGNLLPDWYINDFNIPVYLGTEISTRGVGIYGQTPENLVLVELLKPSTLSLIVDPAMTLTVLNTPAVWAGFYNINSLADYLNAPAIQNLSQIALYEGAYYGLIDTGIITGTESPRFIATFLQPAVRYGVTAVVEWVRNTSTNTDLSTAIQIAARQGQYAIDFVDTYGSVLNVAPELGGFDNTVIRDQVDQAVTDIIGNPKIPNIEYANVANITVGNVAVTIPGTTVEDGTLRFAPGSMRG
jgi:hypothetical protein